MIRTLIPVTAALCLAATWLTAVQAATVSVPLANGDFNTVYKPGSTTVTATSFNDGWGYTSSVGSGVAISGGKYAQFTDGTTSTSIDIPGWVSTGSCVGIQQVSTTSFRAYANGGAYGYNGGTLTQTLSGITAQAGTYTLSADLSGASDGCAITYQFWVGSTQLVTTSTSTVWIPNGTASTFTQQYVITSDQLAALSGDLKVVVTFSEYIYNDWHGATQSQIDNLSLSLTSVPEPAVLSLLGLGALGFLGRGRRRG